MRVIGNTYKSSRQNLKTKITKVLPTLLFGNFTYNHFSNMNLDIQYAF